VDYYDLIDGRREGRKAAVEALGFVMGDYAQGYFISHLGALAPVNAPPLSSLWRSERIPLRARSR
jgi:hypothetical protein